MQTEVLGDLWGPAETSYSLPTHVFSGGNEQQFVNLNFWGFFNLKLHFPVNRHFTWKAVPGLNSES